MVDESKAELMANPKIWVVTGVAGFIGSNLAEALLGLGQIVRGVDDFSTGKRANLDSVRIAVGDSAWQRFTLVEGDITNASVCREACEGVEVVLHQAAVVSVPRSFREPLLSVRTNILGFLNMLMAARETRVQKFVYASSSSVYGDSPALPKIEDNIGRPLSPYALGKYADEVLANLLAGEDGFGTTGLRYFNVFGKRQNVDGEYAAVIPKFIKALSSLRSPVIYGDGESTRDFCYIDNVVEANILAATSEKKNPTTQIYNIAVGESTSLNKLFEMLREILARETKQPSILQVKPIYEALRPGDVRHSLADISSARKHLEYEPKVRIREGLEKTVLWRLGLTNLITR